MVSIAIAVIILSMVCEMSSMMGKVWGHTVNTIDAFQGARTSFDTMTRFISQADLNTYYAYYNSNGTLWTVASNTPPANYNRYSELHFISGPSSSLLPSSIVSWSGSTPATRPTHAIFFEAPLGYNSPAVSPDDLPLDKDLNACGFYIEYNSDQNNRPAFLAGNVARYRYRLMQLFQPSESLEIYNPLYAQSVGSPGYNGWFVDAVTKGGASPPSGDVREIADNIIALIVLPEQSSADVSNGTDALITTGHTYSYDSRDNTQLQQLHQLPPLVQVTMVAIDEPSALRFCVGATAPTQIESTLDTLFLDPANYKSDLATLTNALVQNHINYKVYTDNVSILGSKWCHSN